MSNENETLKVSNPRLIIIRELAEGPKMHKDLRIAYFGAARAKANTANTSFYNKLTQAVEEKLVKKDSIGKYSLDVEGEKMLTLVKKEHGDKWMTFLSAIKSEAQLRFEAEQASA